VKQKTAVPQGAAALSLAVLESEGRKRRVAGNNTMELGRERAQSRNHTRLGSLPSVPI
jgi:hypothetical protein